MVVGDNGEVITVIREHALKDLEALLKAKVYLKVEVVVDKNASKHQTTADVVQALGRMRRDAEVPW